MGKPTGFMEFERVSEGYAPVELRLKNYREFVPTLTEEQARLQGARCMDCGIPFCNNGCPVNNIIPDWNDLVYRGDWQQAIEILHSTNNFPEFTGRICPAPCEAACTLGINADAVGIKSIERVIIDTAWQNGWVLPQPSRVRTGKRVAIVGSGPAGLAAAQQLARVGHDVTVFEKNDRIGGLLRYGIPDFKMEKDLIDRRVTQMEAEGVSFKTRTMIGSSAALPCRVANDATTVITPDELDARFDAVILAGGAETPRDLPIPGRDLDGIHFALEFLIPQNRENAGDTPNPLSAAGKHVVVIGGGDTGSDCVGTSNRHGAVKVTQFEVMPQPPAQENKALTWPYWPLKMRTSSSHEEGCEREFAVSTKAFIGADGKITALQGVKIELVNGKFVEVAGSEFEIKADLVLLAMGFTQPLAGVVDAFAVQKDGRGNVQATTDGPGCYASSRSKLFAAGDMRRGQSLVVWAIREGRQCAREVDAFLMGTSLLPR